MARASSSAATFGHSDAQVRSGPRFAGFGRLQRIETAERGTVHVGMQINDGHGGRPPCAARR